MAKLRDSIFNRILRKHAPDTGLVKLAKDVEIPDIYLGIENWVSAAYVVSPRLLERDNPDLQGVPFLFYLRDDSTSSSGYANRRFMREALESGVTYLSLEEYDKLLGLCTVGSRFPNTVRVNGQDVPIVKLVRQGHVPYSFGSLHGQDLARHTPVRSREDYNKFIEIAREVKGIK